MDSRELEILGRFFREAEAEHAIIEMQGGRDERGAFFETEGALREAGKIRKALTTDIDPTIKILEAEIILKIEVKIPGLLLSEGGSRLIFLDDEADVAKKDGMRHEVVQNLRGTRGEIMNEYLKWGLKRMMDQHDKKIGRLRWNTGSKLGKILLKLGILKNKEGDFGEDI